MEQRAGFREFIRQYLAGDGNEISALEHLFAERVYREHDWMTRPQPVASFG